MPLPPPHPPPRTPTSPPPQLHSTGALHTVLFCRLLGAVRPLDAVAESFGEGFVFATCGDRAVAAAVDERAEALGAWALKERKRGARSATVVLALRERLSASSSSSASSPSLGSSSACCSPPWETWTLPIRVSPFSTRREGGGEGEGERELREEEEEEGGRAPPPVPPLRGAEGLRSLLLSVSSRAAARTSHIPPVLTASVVTFPFEITLEGGAAGAEAGATAAAAAGFASSTQRSGSQRRQQQRSINPRSSPSPSSPSPSPSPSAGSVLRGGLGAVKRLLQAAPPPPVLG